VRLVGYLRRNVLPMALIFEVMQDSQT